MSDGEGGYRHKDDRNGVDHNAMFEEMKKYIDSQIIKTEHHLDQTIDLKFNTLKETTSLTKDALDLRLDALKEATTIAKTSMDERLAGMNEFRDSLKDQNVTFVRKSEYDSDKNRTEEDIRSLRESRSELAGKAEQSSVNLALFFSAAGLILSIIGILISVYI